MSLFTRTKIVKLAADGIFCCIFSATSQPDRNSGKTQEGSGFNGSVVPWRWKQANGSFALHVSFAHITPYWQVRVKAIQAIGSIRRSIPDSVIKRLLELRHASSSRVREAADDALAEILALETGIEDD